jgi:hypothetical protein
MNTLLNTTSAEAMLTADLANAPAYLEHGVKAISAFRRGEKADNEGTAYGVYALCQAWPTAIFSARAVDKDGNHIATWDGFDLPDYVNRETEMPKAPDGKMIRTLQTAAFEVVMLKVFGLKPEDLTPRIKTNVLRTMDLAKDIMAKFDSTDIELTSKGALRVPYQAVYAEPTGDKVSDSDIEEYENNVGNMVPLDKPTGPKSLANLRKMVKPAPVKRDSDDNQGAIELAKEGAKTLSSSLSFITGIIHSWSVESDETKIAPTPDLEAKAWTLKLVLDKYWAENKDRAEVYEAQLEDMIKTLTAD